jgi:type II secretory pathway pseudopilin PulG
MGKQHGFSVLELMIVITVGMIITGMAMFMLSPAVQDSRSDAAMRQMVDQLRQAREYAITYRRYVQVQFLNPAGGPYQIELTQMNTLTPGAGAVNPVLSTIPLQSPITYYLNGSVADTPDAFGNASAIDFGNTVNGPPAGMYFQSDGEFVAGGTFLAINGTVFMGVAGQTSSYRAVTVMGPTGRIRGWKYAGTTWSQF